MEDLLLRSNAPLLQQTNPLLVPGGAASHSPQHKVVVALQVGKLMFKRLIYSVE